MQTTRRILSASTLRGNAVVDSKGEKLGDIKDFMVDPTTGTISYAVLSFGGFLGMGDKLFAVPMSTMSLHANDKSFVLGTSKEQLKQAPGFDKDKWPDFASPEFEKRHTTYWSSQGRPMAAKQA
jgi:sporulation protein YlmC with PRC-barrel domain